VYTCVEITPVKFRELGETEQFMPMKYPEKNPGKNYQRVRSSNNRGH